MTGAAGDIPAKTAKAVSLLPSARAAANGLSSLCTSCSDGWQFASLVSSGGRASSACRPLHCVLRAARWRVCTAGGCREARLLRGAAARLQLLACDMPLTSGARGPRGPLHKAGVAAPPRCAASSEQLLAHMAALSLSKT